MRAWTANNRPLEAGREGKSGQSRLSKPPTQNSTRSLRAGVGETGTPRA